MADTGTFRPEFIEALSLLGAAFDAVVGAGHKRPVLVGGGAVEFYTGSVVASGDFDIVTEAQGELERALLALGFERPHGQGVLLAGLIHPTLNIGVQVVAGELFDGAADEERVTLVDTAPGRGVALPPVEDMIADRIGQFCANPAAHGEMLEQAVILYQIAISSLESPLDREYLDSRIRHETAGTYDLRFLTEKANDAHNG